MIKALGKMADGRVMILLGLSRKNTEYLLLGKPIKVDLRADLGIKDGGVVFLMGGETEESMQEELAAFLKDLKN